MIDGLHLRKTNITQCSFIHFSLRYDYWFACTDDRFRLVAVLIINDSGSDYLWQLLSQVALEPADNFFHIVGPDPGSRQGPSSCRDLEKHFSEKGLSKPWICPRERAHTSLARWTQSIGLLCKKISASTRPIVVSLHNTASSLSQIRFFPFYTLLKPFHQSHFHWTGLIGWCQFRPRPSWQAWNTKTFILKFYLLILY